MRGRFATRRDCRLPGGGSSLRAFFRRERGGALIEVMMGALLVALAATAVFKSVDGASAVSSGSKSRAQAAALAQDDQERLRGRAAQSLVDIDEVEKIRRSNVEFTVRSTSRWVADRNAVPDCNSTTSRAGYIQITSTVTWPDMRGSRPIVAASYVAAPNGTVSSNRGAAGILVLNGKEPPQGVPGVTISLSGASSPSATTDDKGCAFFDDLPQGNYTYTAHKANFIDPNGNGTITRPLSVTGGQTKLDTVYLDQAQTVNFRFRTYNYAGGVEDLPSDWRYTRQLNLTSSKLTANYGIRTVPFTGSTVQVNNLFPTSYGTFVGTCQEENDPVKNGGQSTEPSFGATAPYANPEDVFVAPLKITVRYNGTAMQGARVKIVQKRKLGSSCPLISVTGLVTNQAGQLALGDIALPYGRYAVCAEGTVSGFTGHIKLGDTGTTNETPPGPPGANGDRILNHPTGTVVAINATGSNHSNGLCP